MTLQGFGYEHGELKLGGGDYAAASEALAKPLTDFEDNARAENTTFGLLPKHSDETAANYYRFHSEMTRYISTLKGNFKGAGMTLQTAERNYEIAEPDR